MTLSWKDYIEAFTAVIPPMTRRQARACGYPYYRDPAGPCLSGHDAVRFTNSGQCSACWIARRKKGLEAWRVFAGKPAP